MEAGTAILRSGSGGVAAARCRGDDWCRAMTGTTAVDWSEGRQL
jgi:hypothetical protein